MKKLWGLVWGMWCFYGIEAQDTFRFKGLLMSAAYEPYRSSASGRDLLLLFTFPLETYMVAVDSSFNFFAALENGIFITHGYNGKGGLVLDIQEKLKISKLEPTEYIHHLWNRDQEILTVELPTRRYWKKANQGHNMPFYVMECEFKYIFFRKVDLEVLNLKARNGDKAYKSYPTTVYYITEIMDCNWNPTVGKKKR